MAVPSPIITLQSRSMPLGSEAIVKSLESDVSDCGDHLISLICSARSPECKIIKKIISRLGEGLEGFWFLELQKDGSFAHSKRMIDDPYLKRIQKTFFEREISFGFPKADSLKAMKAFHSTLSLTKTNVIQALIGNLPHVLLHLERQIADWEKTLVNSLSDPSSSAKISDIIEDLGDLEDNWSFIQRQVSEYPVLEVAFSSLAGDLERRLEGLHEVAEMYDCHRKIASETTAFVDSLSSFAFGTDESIARFLSFYEQYKILKLKMGEQTKLLEAISHPHAVLLSEENNKDLAKIKTKLKSVLITLCPQLVQKAMSLKSIVQKNLCFLDESDHEKRVSNIPVSDFEQAQSILNLLGNPSEYFSELEVNEHRDTLLLLKFARIETFEIFNKIFEVQQCFKEEHRPLNGLKLRSIRNAFLKLEDNSKIQIKQRQSDPTFLNFLIPFKNYSHACASYIQERATLHCYQKVEQFSGLATDLASTEEKDKKWHSRLNQAILGLQDFPEKEILELLSPADQTAVMGRVFLGKIVLQCMFHQNAFDSLTKVSDSTDLGTGDPYKVASVLDEHQKLIADYRIESETFTFPREEIEPLLNAHIERIQVLKENWNRAVRREIYQLIEQLLTASYGLLDDGSVSARKALILYIEALHEHVIAKAHSTNSEEDKKSLMREMKDLLICKSISKALLSSFILDPTESDFDEAFETAQRKLLLVKKTLSSTSSSPHKERLIEFSSKLESRLELVFCDFLAQTMLSASIPLPGGAALGSKALVSIALAYFFEEMQIAAAVSDELAQKQKLRALFSSMLSFTKAIDFFVSDATFKHLLPEGIYYSVAELQMQLQSLALKGVAEKFADFAQAVREELSSAVACDRGEDYFLSKLHEFGVAHVQPFLFSEDDRPEQICAFETEIKRLADDIHAIFVPSTGLALISSPTDEILSASPSGGASDLGHQSSQASPTPHAAESALVDGE